MAGGYDSELEDRLFAEIDWPTDGYRLFEIGHFIGDRDWFDGEWESNCIFVPRAWSIRWAGWTRASRSPGGGFVNLDFFERMVGTPGVNLVTMLGEGSFHQVHGGTTTNVAEPDELVRAYEDQYEELRGRAVLRAAAARRTTSAACRRAARRIQAAAHAQLPALPGRPRRQPTAKRPSRPDAGAPGPEGPSSSTPSGAAASGIGPPGSAGRRTGRQPTCSPTRS